MDGMTSDICGHNEYDIELGVSVTLDDLQKHRVKSLNKISIETKRSNKRLATRWWFQFNPFEKKTIVKLDHFSKVSEVNMQKILVGGFNPFEKY